ncbi:MAG: geranylgeranylglyceryl/heptaprenylglyceryl phosphate synthase [Candidatus Saliniplasma sp.]
MNVMNYIKEKVSQETLHMGLIDPDEQKPSKAGEIAALLEESDSDAVMVGGSTGIEKEKLDKTVKKIRDSTDLPIILFPCGASMISPYADAIYFMSMLNSRDMTKVIGEQVIGAPIIKELGIEPLPMGYLIIEPGMTVGDVGKADLLPRNNPSITVSYSLAAQYLGMELIYLEAGSGAPEPVPKNIIESVKENIDVPLIVGGGIRSPEKAADIAKAGADIIVTGTVIEESKDLSDRLKGIISAIK